MKYGVWNVQNPQRNAVNALVSAGYAPLTAMILASRGIADASAAAGYLDCNAALPDPFLMTDMALAAGRVGLAMTRGEKIAVFGDYDVDGITATCLLTDFLRRHGADVVSYIPGRLEEGYGLNPIAIRQLSAEGVKLIVTVDCGITAVEEAQLCASLGIDLVITDHHECKDQLPEAVAVVDPHRPDCGYPRKILSGVGVAFKLASALCGSQEEMLQTIDYHAFTDHTITDESAMRDELARIRQQGYAIDDCEHEDWIYCVAAPIFDNSGSCIAGISLSGAEMYMRKRRQQLAGLLIAAANHISSAQ